MTVGSHDPQEPTPGAGQQAILLFMTTEHFTLQTAIALALVAQLSGLGSGFRAFRSVVVAGSR